MPCTQRVGNALARLLRHRLFLLAALIGAAYLFSAGTASARPPSPGKVPNGNVYYCGTCHESGHMFSDSSPPVPSTPVHGADMQGPFGSTTPVKTWTLDLANQDSDNDGFTNGEELQDPSGAWAIGQPDPGDVSFVSNPSDNNLGNNSLSNECDLSYRATPPAPQLLDIVGYTSPASGDVSFGASTISPLPIDYVRYTVKNGSNATVYDFFSTSPPFRSSAWNTKAVPDGSYTVTAQVVEKRNKTGVTARSASSSGETIVVNNSAPSFGPVGEQIGTAANPCDIGEKLNGIAAISDNDVWAVGIRLLNGPGDKMLIKHWDGVRWTSVISPNVGSRPNDLHAVSASGPSDAWAVGVYNDEITNAERTLTLRWDGALWKAVASPNLGTATASNQLNGVVALSPTNAWAVGYYDTGSGDQRALILHWDGASWQPEATVPEPVGGTNIKLYGIAAASANDIWAVGTYMGASGRVTLTLHWNGTAWSIVASPNPLTGFNQFSAVTALPSGAAWAVGYTSDGTGFRTLAARWNGTSWQATSTPSPGNPNSELLGVAAIGPNDVCAVGYGGISNDDGETLVLHWDGTSWKIVTRPDFGNTTLNAADAAGGLVWAAGTDNNNSNKAQTLVERYLVTTKFTQPPPPTHPVYLPLVRR
jgi:uncharacterized membrane protein